MENYTVHLLKQIGKTDIDSENIKIIAAHIQMMFFNIIGVISTVALLKNKTVISLEDVKEAKAKFNLKCDNRHKMIKRIMKGGEVMASEFFGINSGSYNESNGNMGTVMSKVDFQNGIARPELGPAGGLLGGGSGKKKPKHPMLDHKDVKKYIKLVLEYHNIKFDSESKEETFKIIEAYLLCLMNELKGRKKMGGQKLSELFQSKDFSVFN